MKTAEVGTSPPVQREVDIEMEEVLMIDALMTQENDIPKEHKTLTKDDSRTDNKSPEYTNNKSPSIDKILRSSQNNSTINGLRSGVEFSSASRTVTDGFDKNGNTLANIKIMKRVGSSKMIDY